MHTFFEAKLLRQLAEQAGQLYFIYELVGKSFTYLNPAFSRLLETPQEIIAQQPETLLAFLHPEDQSFLEEEFRLFLEQKRPRKFEFRLRFSGARIKWLQVSVYPLAMETNFFIGGYADDITTNKAYQANLLKFNAKKDSTLEILSHDLAGPFANIEALIDMLEEQIIAGETDVKNVIDFIKQDAKRGSDLIRDFVHNEFLESTQVELNRKRVDIAAKIATLMDTYKNGVTLIPKHFEFIPSQRPIYVYVDESKFMQVLNNLISNAIKFTPDQGIITLTLEDRETDIIIKVADNGIGIPVEHQAVLFDKFTKARRPGIRGEKSVGLGMSIIKKIIELHEGEIWFESRENEGTIFFIRIPKTKD